jgi:hypothetical protein
MQCCSFDSAPRDRIEATTELNGRVPDSAPHGKMIVPASCCLTVTKATQARSHCFRWRLGASERGGCVQVPVSSLPSHSLSHLLKHLLYTFMAFTVHLYGIYCTPLWHLSCVARLPSLPNPRTYTLVHPLPCSSLAPGASAALPTQHRCAWTSAPQDPPIAPPPEGRSLWPAQTRQTFSWYLEAGSCS